MSKYNLTDILNEYVGGGRIGTLEISFKELSDKMDELENSGKVVVRRLEGPSGDGKVNREFEVVAMEDAIPGGNKQEKGFTVYDYKFGFDPGADERAFEEYPFSIGGSNLALAMDLFDGAKPYGISINENKVIKDLAKADEVIKMIKMMNPDVKADLLMKIARMGQDKMKESINEGDLFSSEFDRPHLKDIIRDLNKGLILDMPTRRAYKFLVSLLDKEDKEELGLNENMYIDDEEFEMEMGRSKKDSLRKEMMIHVSELLDGNIDRNDFMNVVDDIMAELELNEIDIDSVSNDPGSGDADNPTGEELEAGSGYDAVEENIVKEGVVKKLRTLLKNKGSESQIDAYLKSLNNDIRLNGYDDYEDFDDDDWVEDYEEYINDKMDINESSQEESVAKYIIDYYRNPNKPEESMVTDEMVDEYYRTHKDWDQEGRWDGSKEGMEAGMRDFEEFFDFNYGIRFDDSRDIDENLKKHFKRFM